MTAPVVLGIDIGGSSVKYLLASADSPREKPPVALARGRRSTPSVAPVDGLEKMIRALSEGHRLLRVAVSVPGIVDESRGHVVRCANIPALDDCALGPELSERLGIPVDVVNDGHAAAVAEAAWGAGAGHADVFVLALGTGIAGAHVQSGDVVGGAHGSAGELGHVTIRPDGALCSCGRRGCLETVIGAPALRAAWEAVGGKSGPEGLLAAYEEGDARARMIVEEAAAGLSEALLTLCALVDPGSIVIGGGLASAPHRLVLRAAEMTRSRATFHRVPEIVPAKLGGWAGANGTVLTALRAFVPA